MSQTPIETERDLVRFAGNPPSGVAFRGHRDASWKLESTVERAARKKFGDSFQQQLPKFEAAIIDQFIERCHRLRLGDIYYPTNKLPDSSNAYEWLSLLQHYGHPTRLIDFTDDLWVAFYFALTNSDPHTPFAIYTLQMHPGDRYASNKSPKDFDGKPYEVLHNGKLEVNVNELLGLAIKFSHFRSAYSASSLATKWHQTKQNYGWDTPYFKNTRVERQSGRFLYQVQLDGQIEQISEVTKHTISAKLRTAALGMLQDKGFKHTREFLFPTFEPVT